MFHNLTPTDLVLTIVAILIALTVHEFMHGYVAFKLGDDTAFEGGRVSFNPLRHIDPVMTVALPIITILAFGVPILAAKPVPYNPARVKYDDFGAALVAAAGPVINLVMAFVGAIIFKNAAAGSLFAQFLDVFVVLNVALFVFNLIPIPPLDGSRVLYAFAPDSVRKLFDQLEPIGLLIIFALVLMGGFGGLLTNLNQHILNLLP